MRQLEVRILPCQRYNIVMDLNHEIEKYWRNKFADELEECIMTHQDDDQSKWFNEGIRYSSMYIRYRFDDSIEDEI